MENRNIYVEAMRIGAEKVNTGIKYSDLKSKIKKELGIDFNGRAELAFIKWFLESFNSDTQIQGGHDRIINSSKAYLTRGDRVDHTYRMVYEDFASQLWFLNGETFKQYIDYLELQEARVSSKEAMEKSNKSIRIAQWALWLSVFFSVASIVVSFLIVQIYPTPEPLERIEVKNELNVKYQREILDEIKKINVKVQKLDSIIN
ncbi:hypothetical protein GTQ40_15750 [Flavobacteriaceae bacterium R38]|nr:hypothetical protein [Flavobacteriaceae bacterium R38]